jgi:S-DNA-T family DNA segregation ATPase FtsK/SpoIIIE
MRTITASLDNIPEALREYIGKRSAELCALAFAAAGVCLALALASWSSQDPSLNYATDGPVRNLLGAPGALIADLLMQLIGLSAILVLAPLFSWAWLLANHHRVDRVARRQPSHVVGDAFA